MPTTIPVVQVVDGWGVGYGYDGSVGTRTYVDASVLPGTTPTYLPAIGDAWSTETTGLVVSSIGITWLGNDGSCGRRYAVSYASAEIEGDSQATYLTNLEVGSEVVETRLIDASDSQISTWPDGALVVDVRLRKRTSVTTASCSRPVWPDDFSAWFYIVMNRVGCVNSTTAFNQPAGSVRFDGCNMVEERDGVGRKRWRAEMRFAIRRIPEEADPSDAWNKMLNPNTGVWSVPTLNGNKLYEAKSFTELFSSFNAPPDAEFPLPEA